MQNRQSFGLRISEVSFLCFKSQTQSLIFSGSKNVTNLLLQVESPWTLPGTTRIITIMIILLIIITIIILGGTGGKEELSVRGMILPLWSLCPPAPLHTDITLENTHNIFQDILLCIKTEFVWGC